MPYLRSSAKSGDTMKWDSIRERIAIQHSGTHRFLNPIIMIIISEFHNNDSPTAIIMMMIQFHAYNKAMRHNENAWGIDNDANIEQ